MAHKDRERPREVAVNLQPGTGSTAGTRVARKARSMNHAALGEPDSTHNTGPDMVAAPTLLPSPFPPSLAQQTTHAPSKVEQIRLRARHGYGQHSLQLTRPEADIACMS